LADRGQPGTEYEALRPRYEHERTHFRTSRPFIPRGSQHQVRSAPFRVCVTAVGAESEDVVVSASCSARGAMQSVFRRRASRRTVSAARSPSCSAAAATCGPQFSDKSPPQKSRGFLSPLPAAEFDHAQRTGCLSLPQPAQTEGSQDPSARRHTLLPSHRP